MSQWMTTFPGYAWLLSTVKKIFGNIIKTGPVPRHIGLIMDGNRRYARAHNIELKEGHNMGFESMASILEILYECGVEQATVYAFLIENFKRSSYEVKWLMDLAKQKFQQITQHGELCEQYGVQIRILGNTSLLQPDVLKLLRQAEDITKNNKRAILNVCFPYTSRDEMTTAIKGIVKKSTEVDDFIIDESTIDKFLYTKDAPPLDLLIRTSGTYRLSDFLLWQSVSSQCSIVVIETLWPQFNPYEMSKILINWSFNKYWYGNSNGYTVRGNPDNLRLSNDEDLEDDEPNAFTTSYNRNPIVEDEDSFDRDSDSDRVIDNENDTVPSEESSINIKTA